MSTDLVTKIIRNNEKAKIAVLNELTTGEVDSLSLAETISRKYYAKEFIAYHFIEALEKDGLIEKRERKYRLLNKDMVSNVLSVNRGEIDKILALGFGKGDLVGQLGEQEKYILSKILSLGNSVPLREIYQVLSSDIDNHTGPFFGYANPSYAKQRTHVITDELVRRGFLKLDNDSVSITEPMLSDFLAGNLALLLLSIGQTREKNHCLLEENTQLKKHASIYDLNALLNSMKNQDGVTNYLVKAVSRIEERSFSEAIINCYRISEYLCKSLFLFLYPNQATERIKHEDKLKRIWNDEEKEKHSYPGIKAVASLLSVILWYRNKMAAHTEMEPTQDAARICIVSILQALKEMDRMNIPIVIQ